jgi:hypothetical protein
MIFEDMREVSARELFFTLHQQPCDPKKVSRYFGNRLDNIEHLITGYWNVLPVLTTREYNLIRKKLEEDKSLATHEHNFFRSEKIMSDLKEFGLDVPSSPIVPFVTFYKNILDKKPYIYSDTIPGSTSVAEKDLIALLKRVDKTIVFFDSLSCDKHLTCRSGRFRKGYFDLVSEDSLIKYAVIYFPLVKFGSSSKDEIISYLYEASLYLKFRSLARDNDLEEANTQKSLLDDYTNMRTDILNCGFYSNRYSNRENVIEISTLRSGSWIRLKLFSEKLEWPTIR